MYLDWIFLMCKIMDLAIFVVIYLLIIENINFFWIFCSIPNFGTPQSPIFRGFKNVKNVEYFCKIIPFHIFSVFLLLHD